MERKCKEITFTKVTTVLLKISKIIIGKLKHIFRGTYKIESVTPKGNYFCKK